MKRTILFSIACLLLLAEGAAAQEGIRVTNAEVQKGGNNYQVTMDLNLDQLQLGSNDMLAITPLIRSNSGTERQELPQIILSGSTRHKVIERARTFGNELPYEGEPYSVTRRENQRPLSIDYRTIVPAEEWMQDAALELHTALSGCANCERAVDQIRLIDRIYKEPYTPQYQLVYIAPEVEPVKARADEHTAQLNFVVAKHDIVRGLGNNAQILDEADRIVREISGNSDLTITHFEFTGWASPEGNQNYNQALSERRANSFANYLISRHGLDRSKIRVVGGGEDWNGVRELVEHSTLPDRAAVLRIIDETYDFDARDAKLRQLSGGATYQTMLREIYPQVRRTIYKIAYEVRAFDVEEAKVIIRTNPRLLSLNEMYLVAQAYEPASKEFKEVFDIAARLYPDQPVAIINASAADIEGGNTQAGIDRMMRISDDHRAWNNLGVAYARMGELEQARNYFEQAAARGNKAAQHNLAELKKVRSEK